MSSRKPPESSQSTTEFSPVAEGTTPAVPSSPSEGPRVLLVGRGDEGSLRAALDFFDVRFTAHQEEAFAALDERWDLVICPYRLDQSDQNGLALLRQTRVRWPDARRVLFARHDQLPELLQEAEPGLVHKVLPLTARPEKVRRALGELLLPDERSVSVSRTRGLDWMTSEDLLRWTAVRLTQVRGVVVRALSPDSTVTTMQFVLLQGHRNEALRKELLQRWLWPIKPRGAPPAAKDRHHPVLRRLGRLSTQAEVYSQRIGKENAWLWVALLPWRGEARLTVALGIEIPPGSHRGHALLPELRALVSDAHHLALDEVTDFPLPDPLRDEEQSGVGQPLLEYDWIATPDYVGPDRRRTPTTFFNRYVFVGRRKRVPSRLRLLTGSFADRFSAQVWWLFSAYVPLALIDTWLTWIHVRRGAVTELNPLLAPLLQHQPWPFVAVKNALALGAFVAVARFHLFTWGPLLLQLVVGLYLALDLYWLVLLALR